MKTIRTAVAAALAFVQFMVAQNPPPGFNPPIGSTQAAPPPQAAPPQQPSAAPQPVPPSAAQQMASGGLNLQNASLREVIDILTRQLKINYILDPRVTGGVTINTYGETKAIDNRALLDTILRINGYAMIPQGDVFRIVPLTEAQRMPGLRPEVNAQVTAEDDRTMLNLLFLKYATVEELAKLMQEFLGEHGKMWSYPPANLLLIQDSRRSMKRLMELVSLFDSDTFANQRVKLFNIENSKPSDLAKELEGILKGISLNDKTSPIKLLPVDRINTLIAVAPNPGVFVEVEKWIQKLDIAVTSSAGAIDNFVYRVRFGFAPTLAMALMGLYSNNPMFQMGLMMSFGGGGMGGMGGGMGLGSGMGMMPGMMGGGGMTGMGGLGMMGGMGGLGMMGGMGGMGMMPGMGMGMPVSGSVGPTGTGAVAGQQNLTGSYLGNQMGGMMFDPKAPRIIPNPFDNTLLIQATRQEYEGIIKLLRQIDIPPRQVLIEARIYEVNLTGALSSGVSAFLRQRGTAAASGSSATGSTTTSPTAGLSRSLAGSLADGSFGVTAGALVGASKELLAAFSLQEVSTRARVVSAPILIATDSVPASINVGQQVPTLTASASTGVQQGGTSVFANNISQRDTGVTLNVMARVNPSGIITLMVNQEVSAPQAPAPSAAIQSPSFSRRNVQTQITLQDGDTVAIGGIISEDDGRSSAGIPVLQRLPIIGAAFGSRSYSRARTELVIFMTPRVIYDMSELSEASDELKTRLRQLNRYLRSEDK